MKFYHFTQNNPGGKFSPGMPRLIIIEAANAADANAFAAEYAGVYFDGVADGKDCPCCGDRWYRTFEGDGYDSAVDSRIAASHYANPDEVRMYRVMPRTIVNLTPHPVTVDGVTYPPDGTVARVGEAESHFIGVVETPEGHVIEGYVDTYGDVIGLPAPVPGVMFIVSAQVRTHESVQGRADVASPRQFIRDSKGIVIGCRSLAFNMTALS